MKLSMDSVWYKAFCIYTILWRSLYFPNLCHLLLIYKNLWLIFMWENKEAELRTVRIIIAMYWFPSEFSIQMLGLFWLRWFYLQYFWVFSHLCFSDLQAPGVLHGVYSQGAFLSLSCANTKAKILSVNEYAICYPHLPAFSWSRHYSVINPLTPSQQASSPTPSKRPIYGEVPPFICLAL